MTTPTQGEHAQPEALTHAAGLESFAEQLPAYGFNPRPLKDAAATIRALHAQVAALTPAPECLTCNDHGAVGNILTAEPCPDCTLAQPAAPQGGAYAELPAFFDCPPGALTFSAEELRAYADATHALRASHGQAPAGAAELENLQRTAVGWQQRAEFAERNWEQCYRVALCNGADPAEFKNKPGTSWHAPTAQPAPAATPQADSQPAPVRDYPPLPARRRAFLCSKCGGHECEPGTLNETHPTCKCGYLGFAEDLDFTADEMRAYVDADRAARAPAGRVTATAAGAVAGPVVPAAWRRRIDEAAEAMSLVQASNNLGNLETTFGRALAGLRSIQSTYVFTAAPTPAAQAADSVLEDAARLLESQHTWLTNVAAANLVRSLAARKQGANHD